MFNYVIDLIKRVTAIFKKSDIKRVTGAEPVISEAMTQKIEQWLKMYRGQAEWVDDYVKSLGLEQGICREFADVTLTELEVSVSNPKLESIVKNFILSNLNENLQSGLAAGSFIIKPLGEDKAEFVTADKFIPIGFSSDGRLTDVVFVGTKKISDNSYYRRFERHELTSTGLHISNMAYHSSNESTIGTQCMLAEVDEWANLPEDVMYPTDRVDFGYYRNPIKNEIDDTFCGVSIFEGATEHIRKADIQYGRLDWEFESGERAVHVDNTALQPIAEFSGIGKRKYKLPQLNKRLYRGLNLQTDGGDLYKEYSPEFRDENIINGLEQIKRTIEFIVGLAYGDLSDAQFVDKTATEVLHSKERKYNRVNAIENNLKKCLEDFCFGLAFYNGLTKSGYEFICNFSDSILTDEESKRKQDMQDVAIGAMRLWEYRMKWYNEDEKTAKANVSNDAEVIE